MSEPDPIGDALRADADAARAEIRAAGIICPSCGVNLADLDESHALTIIRGKSCEEAPLLPASAQCNYGPLADLGTFDTFKAAANIRLLGEMRRRQDEAFAAIIGTGPVNFTGLLDVLADHGEGSGA